MYLKIRVRKGKVKLVLFFSLKYKYFGVLRRKIIGLDCVRDFFYVGFVGYFKVCWEEVGVWIFKEDDNVYGSWCL